VFGNNPKGRGYRKADAELSNEMMGYWTRFARTGDPNGEGCPKWSAYTQEKDEHLVFDTTIKADKNLRKKYCDFWDSMKTEDGSPEKSGPDEPESGKPETEKGEPEKSEPEKPEQEKPNPEEQK
jgi:para-nitrobenzyl esterase